MSNEIWVFGFPVLRLLPDPFLAIPLVSVGRHESPALLGTSVSDYFLGSPMFNHIIVDRRSQSAPTIFRSHKAVDYVDTLPPPSSHCIHTIAKGKEIVLTIAPTTNVPGVKVENSCRI